MERELKALGVDPSQIASIQLDDGTNIKIAKPPTKTVYEKAFEVVGRESTAKMLEDFKNRSTFERKEIRGKKVMTFVKKEVPDEEQCTCKDKCTCHRCPKCGLMKEEEEVPVEEEVEEPECTCKKHLRAAPKKKKEEEEPHERKTLTIRTQNSVRREYPYAPLEEECKKCPKCGKMQE